VHDGFRELVRRAVTEVGVPRDVISRENARDVAMIRLPAQASLLADRMLGGTAALRRGARRGSENPAVHGLARR
jgi:hypothetical protein